MIIVDCSSTITSGNIYNAYPQAINPYAICFSCHDDSMLKQTGYEDSTNFRDTAKGVNDHWFHVVDAVEVLDKIAVVHARFVMIPTVPISRSISTLLEMGEVEIFVLNTPN